MVRDIHILFITNTNYFTFLVRPEEGKATPGETKKQGGGKGERYTDEDVRKRKERIRQAAGHVNEFGKKYPKTGK